MPLASLNSAEFIIPAIADAIEFSFSGPADPYEQLMNQLSAMARRPLLIVLDNLEHLLSGSPEKDRSNDEATWLITTLLQRLPNLKILATSLEGSHLHEEWIFELHGLPVPSDEQISQLEDYSSVELFLQFARQQKADFELQPGERAWLAKLCQLVDGTPLALELAAAWAGMLSIEEITQEIASNLDFLTTRMVNVPERHRSFRAVFAHSWKLLTAEERQVLCRLAVFRGGFQRQAAEKIAGASLPVLMSLLSKSLLLRRENGRYDLLTLIRQCALEKLEDSGDCEETRRQHLAYFARMAQDAHQGMRSQQTAEWLKRIEQEHNNIRAALEWAFMAAAPPERVDEGLCLIASIDRYWSARNHVREVNNWLERGLKASSRVSLCRAKALRIYGWLYNHGDDRQAATALLEQSVAIARQLNDETCQANALDTLGDIAWRFGDFEKARDSYAESLELFRRCGEAHSIGLSLASAGRMHVDFGHCQEAEPLLMEGLALLESANDVRGRGYCLNALGRLALLKGEAKLAGKRFRQALRLNYALGYKIDISEILHELAVVAAILGDEQSATLLLAAALALQKEIGLFYPAEEPIYRLAPQAWLKAAPASQEWARGERMPPDQAVALALEQGEEDE